MRTLVRSLNILIAVLASCVLGLALYGVLRPPVAVSATGAPHTEELAQAPDQGSPDGENQTGDLWQQGLGQTEQGNWAAAIDDLEGALEQSPEIPERYLLLAQAYREAERDDDAAEVLRRGMETIGAESLELPLKAVESTLEMPEDQRTCLDTLYHAFADGDETSFSAALEDWENGQRVWDSEGKHTQNPLWVKTGNLAWDGERLCSDYPGTSLCLWGTSIFDGELSESVPDGAGRWGTVHTWYPDSGAVGYLRLDGQWENGVAVGEVAFHDRCTDAADTFTTYDMTATLDGTAEEVIVRGEVTMQLPQNGAIHTFQLTFQDGALRQEPFRNGVVSCSAHSGCGVHLATGDDSFSMRYQDPYPWGRESPYQEPWLFLNFSYGY